MQPLERLASRADVDKTTNDVAHHVLQKSIGGKFKTQHVSALRYVELAKLFPRGFGLAFSCPERAVVVFSDDQFRSPSHGVNVQALMEPAHAIMQKSGSLRPVQQPIYIAPPCRRKTRMKLFRHLSGPVDRHACGEQRIGAPDPGT